MLAVFPEVAGGFVNATLATNQYAPNVKGCKVIKTGVGTASITLDNPQPIDTLRVWAMISGEGGVGVPLAKITVSRVNDTTWAVATWLIEVAAGPVIAGTPTDYDWCFGVSVIPS